MSKRIFVWTIQHTATWTTLDWLHRQGFAICETVQLINVIRGGKKPTCLASRELERWNPGPVALHSHFSCLPKCHDASGALIEEPRPHQLAVAVSMTNPTVIPIRDPLASCIRKQRQWEMNGRGDNGAQHVRHFCGLVNVWPELQMADRPLAILPWDAQAVSREAALRAATLELNLDLAVTKRFVAENPIQNTFGRYPHKEAYLRRDGGYFRSKLPELWAALKRSERILRPFLADIGYRDLLWWTK